MSSETLNINFWRFSLRELLFVLGFVALACVSLKYVGVVWVLLLSSLVLLILIGAAILTVVDRGRSQAGAIGIALTLSIYGGLLWIGPMYRNERENSELDPFSGKLPTSRLLGMAFQSVMREAWFDKHGDEVEAPAQLPALGNPMRYPMRRMVPDRNEFMIVGHLLTALLLGYVGMRFASFAYDRRTRRSAHPSAHSEP